MILLGNNHQKFRVPVFIKEFAGLEFKRIRLITTSKQSSYIKGIVQFDNLNDLAQFNVQNLVELRLADTVPTSTSKKEYSSVEHNRRVTKNEW